MFRLICQVYSNGIFFHRVLQIGCEQYEEIGFRRVSCVSETSLKWNK